MTWWENAVGYEVYLRSFADGDGNGIGDFVGLTSKLPYLVDLGVDIVWLTPFYPSPLADFGYDISDYRAVDPMYGSLEDFDRLVSAAHDRDLRVVIDIVPNHSSSEHPLFQSAIENGPGSDDWDYYVWRDPAPDGGPPNNWLGFFGGPAWTFVPRWDKYYMHMFLPEQPDLNWASPRVRDDFVDTLWFWRERGVDGFRIDVAHSLVEDSLFRDNPRGGDKGGTVAVSGEFDDYEHLHDYDQPEVTEIYRRWRRELGSDTLLVGEVYITDPERVVRYITEGCLDQSFFFGLNRIPWDPIDFAQRVRNAAQTLESGWSWIQGSHDENRAVTRFGGGRHGWERSMALWVAMMGLPGTPFLYQGDELGLEDGVIAPEDIVDPVGIRNPEEGRDPSRTPMPWTGDKNNGFSTGEPWLRSEPRPETESVESQSADPGSPLNQMKRLIQVRRERPSHHSEPVRWIESPPGTLAFARDGVAYLTNLTDEIASVDFEENWEQIHSVGEGGRVDGGQIDLGPRSGVILRRVQ